MLFERDVLELIKWFLGQCRQFYADCLSVQKFILISPGYYDLWLHSAECQFPQINNIKLNCQYLSWLFTNEIKGFRVMASLSHSQGYMTFRSDIYLLFAVLFCCRL